MTPFASNLLLGVIAILVVVLLVRIALRWRRSRPSHAAPLPNRAQRPIETPPVAVRTPVIDNRWDAYPPRSNDWTPAPVAGQRLEADDMPFADTADYSFGPATPMLAAMLPESPDKRSRVRRMLKNAGYYTPHAWHNLAATRYLGLILPILVFGALLVVVPQRLEWAVIGALVAFPILGYSLPSLLVQSQATARLSEIEQGMPDMLDMLNMCVSQGMTLPAALQRVGLELRGVYPDLAKELSIVSDQSRIAGLPTALASFADRVDTPEVQTFTSLLIQTEKMGTSVSHALADYSENIRESLRQRADMKANSATFKLLFPTVICLMPAVFMFLLGPAIVQLHDFYSRGGTDAIRANAASIIPAENE